MTLSLFDVWFVDTSCDKILHRLSIDNIGLIAAFKKLHCYKLNSKDNLTTDNGLAAGTQKTNSFIPSCLA